MAKPAIGVDTRNDGGLLYVAPSQYVVPGGEAVAYEWDITPADYDVDEVSLRPLPEEVYVALKRLSADYVVAEEVAEEAGSVLTEDVDRITLVGGGGDTESVVDEGVSVLMRLAEEITNNDTYDDWLRNGLICYNEGLGLDVWERMSRRGKGYEEGACARKWSSFSKTGERKVTQASWWKWLKDNKPARFAELKLMRTDVLSLLETINHNDIAKYFYNLYPNSYVYNKALGWYAIGTNNIWERADKGVPNTLKRHLADTMQDLTREALADQKEKHKLNAKTTIGSAENVEHQTKMKNIIAAYKQFGSSEFCNGVISFLPAYYEDDKLYERMDMNRNVFAFSNGLYDIEKACFRPIEPLDWVCTTTGYPIPTASQPLVRQELTSLMWNLFEDSETAEYMWNVLASAVSGTNRWEELYTFTGSGGNGKGVLSELLKTAFGGYYITQDVSLFTKPRERLDQPVPALVEARPCRLFITTEPEADDKLQGGFLKKVTGGDAIEARTLHSPHIVKYVPQFTLIIQTNAIPRLTKIDGGIHRRLRIIRFPFQFVTSPTQPHHRLGDPDVKDSKCKSATWRDEFILMLLERLQLIRKWKALVPPPKVREITDSYLDDHNPLKDWLTGRYVITHWEEDTIPASQIRDEYNLEQASDSKMSPVKFKELMGYNGIESKRVSRGMVFYGLKRKTDTIELVD